MKKIIILLLVFIASITTFTALNINSNIAYAEDDNLKFETNYFQLTPPIILVTVKQDTEQFNRYNSFSGYYDNLTEVTIEIYYNNYNADYVQFKNAYLNEDELTPIDDGNKLTITILSFEDFNLIELEFEIAQFKLSSEYFAAGLDSENKIDGIADLINYYKMVNGNKIPLEKVGGEYYISYKETETLIIEPQKNITFDNKSLSFTLQGIYYYTPDDSLLIKNYQITFNDAFLDTYVTYGDEIPFFAVYVKDSNVSLSFNNLNLTVPYDIAIVEDGNLKPADKTQFFEDGTKLQITFEPLFYTQLSTYGNGNKYIEDLSYAAGTDTVSEIDGIVKITFTIIRDKRFVVHLDLKTFTINKQGSNLSDAEVDFSKETFQYGDKIRLYSSVDGIREIKSWTISGIPVPKKNGEALNGITRINETTVEIDTAVWYLEHGGNFISNITTGVKSDVILATTIPIGVVVLALAFLLIIILKHSSTKKKIKKLLEEEKMTGYKYNQGSMIADLKEDKHMVITKEDIKAKMKDKKHNN